MTTIVQVPKPIALYPGLSDQVDSLRLDASRKVIGKQRSELGQFLTSAAVARFMASMLVCDSPEVSLLDAGAGVGSLLSAAVELLCVRAVPPKRIQITAYEVDPLLVPYLRDTLVLCEALCRQTGVSFTSDIVEADFITHVVERLAQPLFHTLESGYTCAVLNPPYRKIQTNSLHRKQLQQVGIETSNLYAGFAALAIKLLAAGGELVAITPRSFCNGPYFQPFRNFLLDQMALRRFHLFESREQAFQDDDVLQENVIFSAVKSSIPPSIVAITSSLGPEDEMIAVRDVPFAQVVNPDDPQRFIHLVSDDLGVRFAARVAALPATLHDLGLSVSTGRVVDFRALPFLRSEPDIETVPLIYPTHIAGDQVVWPKTPSKKPNALVQCDQTADLLVPSGYYVLVKRFSAKEERRRVSAATYDPTIVPSAFIGFENHLNYFHKDGCGLDRELTIGLAAFLNSTLIDTYVRQFNGHTQVNATDLRMLRYPTLVELRSIGARVAGIELTQHELDTLIEQELRAMI